MRSHEKRKTSADLQALLASARKDRKFYYVSGQPVELWENSEIPFGWSEEELEEYASSGDWESLFNALVLSATLEHSTEA
jgi:hypothetical protein